MLRVNVNSAVIGNQSAKTMDGRGLTFGKISRTFQRDLHAVNFKPCFCLCQRCGRQSRLVVLAVEDPGKYRISDFDERVRTS